MQSIKICLTDEVKANSHFRMHWANNSDENLYYLRRETGYVFIYPCVRLFVCLSFSPLDYSKCERILMKLKFFLEGWSVAQGKQGWIFVLIRIVLEFLKKDSLFTIKIPIQQPRIKRENPRFELCERFLVIHIVYIPFYFVPIRPWLHVK